MESPGQSLSDFTIDKELGHGSFGMVYRVKSLKNNCIYVIKKINIDHLSQKSQKEVIHEAQILKKLDHPNIVKYFCSFMDGKSLCIVMEYINGGDLHKLIRFYQDKKTFIPESEIWKMSFELSTAIQYLHSKSIIHRDIKTLNILITKNHTIKLADLGASKIVSAPMQVTRIGTPLYLAPELVKHKPYDYKVDIWALGCVIYNLAKLQPPFQAENLITLGMQIVSKNPEPLPSIYSEHLTEFVLKMLSKQPIDRPGISGVISMINRFKDLKEVQNTNEFMSTEQIVMRNSPIIDDENVRFFKFKNLIDKVLVDDEPKIPEFKSVVMTAEEIVDDEKSYKIDEKSYKTDDRPFTAYKTRVVFRVPQKNRPQSAVNKKNPLYKPREIKTLRIPPPCVKFNCFVQKTAKKHITISDLYF
ncbi:hypothetical protein SteCoe_32684 [Stentor coeruleus]|uniref:non-specific serine/threonine protein kinase n=1 Tax=Stentor coeruleus TaxID=5963 RepID=A0A1R2AYI0_9CILI|nr:hypothetical protein SteCoe_32684 [Stentor coeruleus]